MYNTYLIIIIFSNLCFVTDFLKMDPGGGSIHRINKLASQKPTLGYWGNLYPTIKTLADLWVVLKQQTTLMTASDLLRYRDTIAQLLVGHSKPYPSYPIFMYLLTYSQKLSSVSSIEYKATFIYLSIYQTSKVALPFIIYSSVRNS